MSVVIGSGRAEDEDLVFIVYVVVSLDSLSGNMTVEPSSDSYPGIKV